MCAVTIEPLKQQHLKCTDEVCDERDFEEHKRNHKQQPPQIFAHKSMLSRQQRPQQQKKRRKQRVKWQWQSACGTCHNRAGIKWKIIISTIILLLSHISHVLALRKGRLISPSSFTALSGDLHVQLQFSGDEAEADVAVGGAAKGVAGDDTEVETDEENVRSKAMQNRTTARTTQPLGAMSFREAARGSDELNTGEKTMTSILVISKFIDDFANASEVKYDTATNSSLVASAQFNGSLTTSLRAEVTTPALFDETHKLLPFTRVLHRKGKVVIQSIPIFIDADNNVTHISVPCQTFAHGGRYEMQVATSVQTQVANMNDSTNTMSIVDERLRQTLDVRWPSADVQVKPTRLRTYPDEPVEVTLRFPEVSCEYKDSSLGLPQFWLELIYCGKQRSCDDVLSQNISKSSILYMEQVHGYPKHKLVRLGCELFGLAGNYAVQLRPMVAAPNVPITRRFLSIDWSDKFVFNVYARSIFPCDPHTGIGVLYEYPACILEQGDRVRVFGKLRADVVSLKPPTTLHYVAEQRVVKTHHSLYFNCELFTEKFVEYCFAYVSQAISGAVADVRMDCVPTLPLSDSDTGGWGPWSEWTSCSTNCLGGTRNRYRFCDSPPPRYGAKFCEGASVETEKCGEAFGDTWDCIDGNSSVTDTSANHTEVSQELGPGCRCGCIVHLASSELKRVVTASSQSCPGRSFWLIQVDGDENIALSLNFLRFACPAQYITVRDGPLLSSSLLIELNSGSNFNMPTQIESSGTQLLLEFYAGAASDVFMPDNNNKNNKSNTNIERVDSDGVDAACTGGFLAKVELKARNDTTNLLDAATSRLLAKGRSILQNSKFSHTKFTSVHLSAVVFASIIILISALLGAQYVIRYRKYHLAVARRRDMDSHLYTPRASLGSLHALPLRAISTTTLLSEVIYLVKIRPKHQLRHAILRESVEAENLAHKTECNDLEEVQVEESTRMLPCDENDGSIASFVSLRNEISQSPRVASNLSLSPSLDEVLGSITGTAETSGIFSGTPKNSDKDTESIISSGLSSMCSDYLNHYETTAATHASQRLESTIFSDSLRCASESFTNSIHFEVTKEKQNQKMLLTRSNSEFSLGNQEELEFDYYDYKFKNASYAPSSYPGKSPEQLIWVPPLEIITNRLVGDAQTPEATSEPDETAPLSDINISQHSKTKSIDDPPPLSSSLHPPESLLRQTNISINADCTQSTTYFTSKQSRSGKQQSRSTSSLSSENRDAILYLQQVNATKSVRNICSCKSSLAEANEAFNSISDLIVDSMTASEVYNEKKSKYEQIDLGDEALDTCICKSSKLDCLSDDSAIVETRGLMRAPSLCRMETNV